MKVEFEKHLRSDTLLEHIVVEGLTTACKVEEVCESEEYKNGIILDIEVKVNGIELDVESFAKLWQEQVESMINDAASEKVEANIQAMSEAFESEVRRMYNGLGVKVEDPYEF